MLKRRRRNATWEAAGPPPGMMSRPQIIHSGHFMVSEPHADPDPDPDPGSEAALSQERQAAAPCAAAVLVRKASPAGKATARKADDGAQLGSGATYDFDTVNEGACLNYRYGPQSSGALNIDPSLTKLFECMTLAYSGKIVSPKWKTFKGLKLLQRDKIRLNNAIWRAWYLQYVEKRQNPVCSFVTPLECSDIDEHRKPEAVIMEGKYWKRQIGVVIREYHKWRSFFHTWAQKKMDKPAVCGPTQELADALPGVELGSEMAEGNPMDLDPLHDLDALLDTIFSSRNPYGGPNLRGLAHQGNADMIQPTLTQLHPIFGEEFMDTLDPIHGSLANSPSVCHGLQWFHLASCATSISSDSFKLHLSNPTNVSRKEFITSCRSQPTVQAPTLLTDASALDQCHTDAAPVAPGTKEHPPPGDSHTPIPISLDVEPPIPLNGQQTFLPFFPTSPLRISPPPASPILHVQPQTTLVFCVITHTESEKNSLSTSRDPFAVPVSAPPAKGGRCRYLQRIAPAPSSSPQPAPPSASLPCLLTAGPAPLPLTPVMNSAQVCGTPKPHANVIVSSASAAMKSPSPASAAASPDTSAKTKERAEGKTLCKAQERYKCCTAKGSRRSTFTSADYVRRMTISSGFNTLASLVLAGSDQTSPKLSKAALLQKSAAYVERLQQERRQAQETVKRLRGEIEVLSSAIDDFQRQLPPTGAPVLPPQSDQASQLYEEYVRQHTLHDWRFWLFSVVIKPLFDSYTRTVNTGNIKEFCQSVLSWLEQHCTLPILRPAISDSLLKLSKITSILTCPAQLPEQALQAVSFPPRCKSNS
ncbi:MLX-interacting protein-like isoform X2 [Rhineura floridana]|uniref:MLX-interacting protein-like isoform X2 n=1 Tax=Rhineura floridana TaxID=261503 RepID=UPI002AC83EC9|nr:MLX-interacting protein-like isoform X2 [Rhineura floridana]